MKKILVGVDGSDRAFAAVDLAAELAAATKATLVVVYAIELGEIPAELTHYAHAEHIKGAPLEAWQRVADQIAGQAAKRAAEHGNPKVERRTVDGDPATVLLEVAKAEDVDMIVVASQGLGRLEGLLLGSVSQKLVALADRPCLVVR